MGLNLSKPVEKPQHNPNKYEITTQGHVQPSDTPLNTLIDQVFNQLINIYRMNRMKKFSINEDFLCIRVLELFNEI